MTATPPWEFTLVMNISSTQEACVSTEADAVWKTETRFKHFDPTFQNCVLFGLHPDKSDVLVRADDEERELCVRPSPATHATLMLLEAGCWTVFCCCWPFFGFLPWAYRLRLIELEGGRKRASVNFY